MTFLMPPSPSFARFRPLLACLGAGMLMLSGLALAEPLMLQNQQATQLMLPLQDTLQKQALTVVFRGWKEGETFHEGVPEGFKISFPKKLSPSQKPILPISLQVVGDTDLTQLVLVFVLTGLQGSAEVEVPLQLPQRARLAFEVADTVTTLPGYTVQVPVHIHNIGPIPTRVHLELSLALQAVADFDLAPGEARSVNLAVPTQATDQKLEIGLVTPTRTIRKTILLRGVPGLQTPYRVKFQLGSGLESGGTVGNQLRLDASFSETVRFSAAVQASGTALQLPSLTLAVGKTTVNYGVSPATGVAGSVGPGFYLSTEPVKDLQVGAGWGTSTPSFRVGVKQSGRMEGVSWSVAGHTDLAWTSPELAGSLQTPQWTWNAKVTPGQQTDSTLSASYNAQGLGLNGRVQHGKDGWGGEVRATFKPAGTPDSFSGQVNVLGSKWQDLGLTYSNRQSEWSWTYRPDQTSDLQGNLRVSLQDLTLRFTAGAQLQGLTFKGAQLGADLTYVQGPWQVNLTTSLQTGGTGTLNLTGKHTWLLDSGELQLEGGARTSWQTGTFTVLPFAGLTYRDVGGWQATLSASKTREGINYRGRLAYQFELPVPPEVTGWLDGAPPSDPSARTVRIDVQGSGFQPLLEGVKVSGCGMSGVTDPNGKVELRGTPGPCTLSIDQTTLPKHTFLQNNAVPTQPGETLTVQLIPTFDLRGRVEYQKTEGVPFIPPPPRKVKVTFKGIDTFWKDVELPDGAFEIKDLPIGEYTVTAEDGPPVKTLLVPGGALLVVTLPPASVQTVKKTTPPLKLAWKELTVRAGGEARLTVTSEGPINKVTLKSQDWENTHSCQNRTTCEVVFQVPPTPGGLLAVQMEVLFQDGAVARRSAQLIVPPKETP